MAQFRDAATRALDETLARAGLELPAVVHLLKGHFEEIAPRLIAQHDIDLVVMKSPPAV